MEKIKDKTHNETEKGSGRNFSVKEESMIKMEGNKPQRVTERGHLMEREKHQKVVGRIAKDEG